MSAAAQRRIKAILTPAERAIFQKLSTPQKIQDYLDMLPINFERRGETAWSPRQVLQHGAAHCFEGALFAAAALAYHRQPPLLLDLRAGRGDDHVVALFRIGGLWGAISKTNHAVLRYRDPVYRDMRELALSYFHEYFEDDGEKSLRWYSRPFNLSRYAPERWITPSEDLFWLVNALDNARHFLIAPQKIVRKFRRATPFEVRTTRPIEWSRSGRRSK